MEKISLIGGGNMATSLIGGLIDNEVTPEQITVSDPDMGRQAFLSKTFGVSVAKSNTEAIIDAATVILAVKPQVLSIVANELAVEIEKGRPLIISVAAGVKESNIRGWLNFEASIVRVMPNTPALIGLGASGLYANEFVSTVQRQRAERIMAAVGLTEWVNKEELLDAITALSGSGPAYCFLLLELMAQTGEKLGLKSELAQRFAKQTMLGAATMADRSSESLTTLRQNVTSPGGTTERALAIFKEGSLEKLVHRAITGAHDRALELGDSIEGEK